MAKEKKKKPRLMTYTTQKIKGWNGWGADGVEESKVHINSKKTPEQIATQLERLRKVYSDLDDAQHEDRMKSDKSKPYDWNKKINGVSRSTRSRLSNLVNINPAMMELGARADVNGKENNDMPWEQQNAYRKPKLQSGVSLADQRVQANKDVYGDHAYGYFGNRINSVPTSLRQDGQLKYASQSNVGG